MLAVAIIMVVTFIMVVLLFMVAIERQAEEARKVRLHQEVQQAEHKLNSLANQAFQTMFDEARRHQGGFRQ